MRSRYAVSSMAHHAPPLVFEYCKVAGLDRVVAMNKPDRAYNHKQTGGESAGVLMR